MRAHQGKRSSTSTIHGSFSRLSSPPSQIDATNTRGKDKGFFRRDSSAPSNISRVEHAMRLCVLDKGFHGVVALFSAVLFDEKRFARFWLGFLWLLWIPLLAVGGVASLFASHDGRMGLPWRCTV
jgi:hypothetical protein